jgi:hypothetical protein
MYTYVYLYAFICRCIHTHIHTHINTYIYLFIYIYVYIIYIYIFIYIYTYIYIDFFQIPPLDFFSGMFCIRNDRWIFFATYHTTHIHSNIGLYAIKRTYFLISMIYT